MMEITFQEVELVRVLLSQCIAAADVCKKIGGNDYQAVSSFIGYPVSDEEARERIAELMQQKEEAVKLFNKISDEFGFDHYNDIQQPG